MCSEMNKINSVWISLVHILHPSLQEVALHTWETCDKKNQASINAFLSFSALSASPLNYDLRGKHVKLKVNFCFNSSPGRTNAWDFPVFIYFSSFLAYRNAWCLFGLRCSFLDYSHLNKVSLCDISVLAPSLLRSVSFWCSFIREREKSLPHLRAEGTGVHIWNSICQWQIPPFPGKMYLE